MSDVWVLEYVEVLASVESSALITGVCTHALEFRHRVIKREAEEMTMQNRYAGDIGDYSKLGLLRALHLAGFSIGLNWYLTPDETHNRHYDPIRGH